MADAKTEGAEAPKTEPAKGKSIVDPKYRDKYKGEKDWLAQYLHDNASTHKDVKRTKPNPDNADEKITVTEKVVAGVDTDALIALAKKNGLNVENLEKQKDTHGFGGRCRMTVRNMLQTVIKQRHGMFNAGGTFIKPPADFLAKIGAPEQPTHNQDGTKIEKPKAEKPADSTAADAKAPAKGAKEKTAA